MDPIQVVVDATRKRLFITFKDERGVIIPVTGWTARMQGKSKSLNGFPIDVAGVIDNGPGGIFKWDPIVGTGFPGATELAGMSSVLADLQIRLVDASGKVAYGPDFQIEWKRKPV